MIVGEVKIQQTKVTTLIFDMPIQPPIQQHVSIPDLALSVGGQPLKNELIGKVL